MPSGVLIIGLQAGGGSGHSRSGEILRLASRAAAEQGHARVLEVPPEPDRSLLKALEYLDLHLPKAVLVVGILRDRKEVTVERTAVNAEDTMAVPIEPIDAAGPLSLACTLPSEEIIARITGAGIAAVLSEAPGSSRCNRLAYALLRYLSLRGEETWFHRQPPAGLCAKIGTLHVPIVETAGEGETVAVQGVARAVALAVEAVAASV